LNYIGTFQLTKLNLFTLFDFTTTATNHLTSAKHHYAKQIIADRLTTETSTQMDSGKNKGAVGDFCVEEVVEMVERRIEV
jgi:hypothetical protein